MEWAENSLNHKWTWKKKYGKKDEVLYNDGGPFDKDIRDTMSHLKDQEAIHGVYELPPKDYLGLQLEDEKNIN